jgi:hypothetical protein
MYIMAVRKPEQGLNDWGYGQILAVLIWAPVLVEFVRTVVKTFRGATIEGSDQNQLDGEPINERKPAMSHVRED